MDTELVSCSLISDFLIACRRLPAPAITSLVSDDSLTIPLNVSPDVVFTIERPKPVMMFDEGSNTERIKSARENLLPAAARSGPASFALPSVV